MNGSTHYTLVLINSNSQLHLVMFSISYFLPTLNLSKLDPGFKMSGPFPVLRDMTMSPPGVA